jgi:hypothetical protein
MAERGFTDPMPVYEVQVNKSQVRGKRNPDAYKLLAVGFMMGALFTNVLWFLFEIIVSAQ